MNRFFLYCFALLTCYSKIFAQQENHIWAFGNNAGLDFTNGNPVPFSTNMQSREGTASVADATGQLLFYTEGSTVWDRNGNIMPNGIDLTPFATTTVPAPTGSTTQGALIVPVPASSSRYFVFSMTCLELGTSALRLYYSVVDMNLNGGLGDIVPTEKSILVDSALSERMTAVVGQWCNIWLLTSTDISPAIKAYEITANGVNPTPVVSPAGPNTSLVDALGVLKASPDGRKLVSTKLSIVNAVTLFDFDNGTGMATNPKNISPLWGSYGAEFSPDNTKLYVNGGTVAQLDLSSNNTDTIIASRTDLGVAPSSQFKLAPDGKIYFTGSLGTLSRIAFPNVAGTACGLQLNSLPISGSALLGMPNIVPIMVQDTFITSQTIKAGCFATAYLLEAQNMSDAWGFQWNTGATTPQIQADTPGTYVITYRKSPCSKYSDTFKLSFPYGSLPLIQTSTACTGSQNGKAKVFLNPTDTNTYSFVWCNAANDTLSFVDSLVGIPGGTYTLHIASAFCDTTLLVTIPEVSYEVAFISNEILCEDTDMQLQNNSNNHFSNFLWNFGNGITSTQTNPVIRYDDPDVYEITLIGNGSICNDTLKKLIIVDPQTTGSFVMDRDSICTGESIVFSIAEDSTLQRLYWHFGDGATFNTTYEIITRHAFDQQGRWPVTLTANYRACPVTFHADTLHIFPLPYVDLGPDTTLCLDGRAYTIGNRAPEPATSYQRHWNTGSTEPTLDIVHPGTYALTISAAPLGCSNTGTIDVRKDCYIDIPNAFTPNGDGVNDYFFPRQLLSRSVTQFEMVIYNKWGQVIFRTKETRGRGWDGKFNGIDQPQGVYLYTITATIYRQEQYQGNVTLIR
ncbi:MAG: gliding motility-associated C-terminal domain-containing protein [Taibaiella sp.]|jgi:gliding motility-associated-like protein